MFQAFSRLFVLIASASIVVGNGTQIIDWHALNDAQPTDDDSHIQLILYSRKFKEGTTDMSFLKKKLNTYILIHGFNDNLKDSIMLPLLTKNYLERERCNVVIVDWAEHAKGPWFINAAKNTLLVGKELGAWLDSSGLDMNRVTLVGFSMGAHVAGDAGHFSKSRVNRIVALDPAHFLFQNSPPEFRLDSTDAEIVEVVHTSGGYVGEKESLGTRDFFPNGGMYPQPGCSPDPTGTCSHRRAYYYYSEAIKHPDDNFRARRCTSYDHFVKHQCKEKGLPVILHLVNTNFNKHFTGNFYFITNSKEPFMRRNVSTNATTTEKYPSPTTDKHRMTSTDKQQSTTTEKRQSTTTDKHRLTTDKNQGAGMDRQLTTTDKQRPTPIDKYQGTSTDKHRPMPIDKNQGSSTDKHRPMPIDKYQGMSTDKHRPMPIDKYQHQGSTVDTHRTTSDNHRITMTATSKPKLATQEDKNRPTTADKHQPTTTAKQALPAEVDMDEDYP